MSFVAGLLGGVMQASSANKAAKAQTKAADAQLALQKQVYDEQTKNFAPFLDSGVNALGAVNYEMGLGNAPMIGGTAPSVETVTGVQPGVQPGQPVHRFSGNGARDSANPGAAPTQAAAPATQYKVGDQTFSTLADAQAYADAHKTGATAYGGFQATPGYQFQFDQGTAAVNALAGARGGLNSGRTLQDLTTFGQGVANQEYGNYFNRLMGLVSGGQAAAGNQASAGANYAANGSNAFANKGNAQAAGAIGVSNAFSNTANNLIGLYQYQNAQKPANTSGIGWGGWSLG